MVALEIRKDRPAALLRRLARFESDARVSRRLPAIANARVLVQGQRARHGVLLLDRKWPVAKIEGC
jgi:hypothetical protein